MSGFDDIMNAHLANCYQAHGLSQQGAGQLANGEMPSNPADKAMTGAYAAPLDTPASATTGQAQQNFGTPMTNQAAYSSPNQDQDGGGNLWGPGNAQNTGPGNLWGTGNGNTQNAGSGNLWGPGTENTPGSGGNVW